MFQEIWPTCDQFLNMMTGSEYEHALLLTNFFASIGKKSFLVLGQVGKNLIWTEVFFWLSLRKRENFLDSFFTSN